MSKQQCQECGEWFDDSELDAHLNKHADEPENEEQTELPALKCLFCDGTEFDRESGSIQGSWQGVTRHRVILMVCRKCAFIMPFQEGRTLSGWWGTLKQRKLDSRGLPKTREK